MADAKGGVSANQTGKWKSAKASYNDGEVIFQWERMQIERKTKIWLRFKQQSTVISNLYMKKIMGCEELASKGWETRRNANVAKEKKGVISTVRYVFNL